MENKTTVNQSQPEKPDRMRQLDKKTHEERLRIFAQLFSAPIIKKEKGKKNDQG